MKIRAAQFFGLVAAALLISYLPYVGVPFAWLSTYFHEISHGLAAVLTGVEIVRIKLNLDGSGLCVTRGGSRFLILNAGYLGAIAFGALIFAMARAHRNTSTKSVAVFLSIAIALSGFFYGRDPITWIVVMVIAALLAAVIKLHTFGIGQLALKLVGLCVLVEAIHAPLWTLGGSPQSDAAKLAAMTFLPVIFWAGLWIASGVAATLFLWRRY